MDGKINPAIAEVKIDGTRLVANKKDTTVIVFPNDAVEIFSGGEHGKPIEMLWFNPHTGKASFEKERGKSLNGTLDDLQKDADVEKVLQGGTEILNEEKIAFPKLEKDELRDWMAGLSKREQISREDMWNNKTEGMLVAQYWTIPNAELSPPGTKTTMRTSCVRLGKFVDTDPDMWNQCFFDPVNDPELGSGVFLSEDDKTGAIDVSSSQPMSQTMVGNFASVVRITDDEAKWLSKFTPPPSTRYVSVHRDFLKVRNMTQSPNSAEKPWMPDDIMPVRLGNVAI